MNVYLVERLPADDPWYDEQHGVAVAAESPDMARQLAAESAGGEGAASWLDAGRSEVTEVGVYTGEENVATLLLRDYKPG